MGLDSTIRVQSRYSIGDGEAILHEMELTCRPWIVSCRFSNNFMSTGVENQVIENSAHSHYAWIVPVEKQDGTISIIIGRTHSEESLVLAFSASIVNKDSVLYSSSGVDNILENKPLGWTISEDKASLRIDSISDYTSLVLDRLSCGDVCRFGVGTLETYLVTSRQGVTHSSKTDSFVIKRSPVSTRKSIPSRVFTKCRIGDSLHTIHSRTINPNHLLWCSMGGEAIQSLRLDSRQDHSPLRNRLLADSTHDGLCGPASEGDACVLYSSDKKGRDYWELDYPFMRVRSCSGNKLLLALPLKSDTIEYSSMHCNGTIGSIDLSLTKTPTNNKPCPSSQNGLCAGTELIFSGLLIDRSGGFFLVNYVDVRSVSTAGEESVSTGMSISVSSPALGRFPSRLILPVNFLSIESEGQWWFSDEMRVTKFTTRLPVVDQRVTHFSIRSVHVEKNDEMPFGASVTQMDSQRDKVHFRTAYLHTIHVQENTIDKKCHLSSLLDEGICEQRWDITHSISNSGERHFFRPADNCQIEYENIHIVLYLDVVQDDASTGLSMPFHLETIVPLCKTEAIPVERYGLVKNLAITYQIAKCKTGSCEIGIGAEGDRGLCSLYSVHVYNMTVSEKLVKIKRDPVCKSHVVLVVHPSIKTLSLSAKLVPVSRQSNLLPSQPRHMLIDLDIEKDTNKKEGQKCSLTSSGGHEGYYYANVDGDLRCEFVYTLYMERYVSRWSGVLIFSSIMVVLVILRSVLNGSMGFLVRIFCVRNRRAQP